MANFLRTPVPIIASSPSVDDGPTANIGPATVTEQIVETNDTGQTVEPVNEIDWRETWILEKMKAIDIGIRGIGTFCDTYGRRKLIDLKDAV